MKQLPQGAAFVHKEGQATATVRYLHDTLFVYASCDSLQTLVYEYATELDRLNSRMETKEKNVPRAGRYRSVWH